MPFNPSQLAAQAGRVAALCNLAARIGNGENISGGIVADGGTHAIAANGTGVDIDVDVTNVIWNRRGIQHNLGGDETDVFANAGNSVVQVDGTANFPTATPAATAAEEIKLVVIFGSDNDNANPALQGVCGAAWVASDSVTPTDAEIETAHGNNNYVKLGVITLTRTLADNEVITLDVDLSDRVDQKDYSLIDTSLV